MAMLQLSSTTGGEAQTSMYLFFSWVWLKLSNWSAQLWCRPTPKSHHLLLNCSCSVVWLNRAEAEPWVRSAWQLPAAFALILCSTSQSHSEMCRQNSSASAFERKQRVLDWTAPCWFVKQQVWGEGWIHACQSEEWACAVFPMVLISSLKPSKKYQQLKILLQNFRNFPVSR